MRLLHFSTALLAGGWADDVLVAVDAAGRLAGVQTGVAPPPTGARRCAGAAVPGMANLHSHAFQRAMAGLVERRGPEGDSFWTWREVMYRFLAAMTPDDVEAVAAWLYVEMLEAGFTSVGEFHYLHHDPTGRAYADIGEMAGRIAAAASASGIGLTLLPCFYAHGGCGGAPPVTGQRRFITDIDAFAAIMERARHHTRDLAGAVVGMAPHSLRAVDAGELTALLAANPAGPVHMHAAEQVKEVAECEAWAGARPVAWLLDNAAIDRRWCLIHCTHMTHEETWRLAASGAVAGLCPLTEANLGDGIFDGTGFTGASGSFGIGSDSNVRISLGEELRQLETSQRLRDRLRNRLGPEGGSTGRFLFERAAQGGAQALARGAGRIAVGEIADIVLLDTEHPVLVARTGDALLDAWIFSGGDGLVADVWAGGVHVVEAGRHVARGALRARFNTVMRRLAGSGL